VIKICSVLGGAVITAFLRLPDSFFVLCSHSYYLRAVPCDVSNAMRRATQITCTQSTLPECCEPLIQAQDAHRKTPKNPRRSREILTPPLQKKIVSVAGVGSPNRYIAQTLLSSDIFLYLCIIKPYYISYG